MTTERPEDRRLRLSAWDDLNQRLATHTLGDLSDMLDRYTLLQDMLEHPDIWCQLLTCFYGRSKANELARQPRPGMGRYSTSVGANMPKGGPDKEQPQLCETCQCVFQRPIYEVEANGPKS